MKTALIVILLLLFSLLNIAQGSTTISWESILQVLMGSDNPELTTTSNIIWQLRLPKLLTAILAGASLSIAGLLMQTFFRNPIAGPDVLGISSGAHLGAAILILAMGGAAAAGWGMAAAAILGALAVLLLLLLVAWRLASIQSLLIVGLMLSSVIGALVGLLQYFSTQQDLQLFVFWTMGSLSGTTWQELNLWFFVFLPCLLLAWLLAKPLDAWLLGEQTALALGVSIQNIRLILIFLTAILTGITTAFCGPIAFVGIAVPHLARLLFRHYQHRVLVPVSALLGALVLLICQWLAALPLQDKVLPINVLTSLFGAPVVVFLVIMRK